MQFCRIFIFQIEMHQAVGIVISGAQNLTTLYIFKRGRDPAHNAHVFRICHISVVRTFQCGTVSTQQKYCFFHRAFTLFQCQCRIFFGIQTGFTHNAVYQQAHFFLNHFQFHIFFCFAAVKIQQRNAGCDGFLAAGYCYISHIIVPPS